MRYHVMNDIDRFGLQNNLGFNTIFLAQAEVKLIELHPVIYQHERLVFKFQEMCFRGVVRWLGRTTSEGCFAA